MDDDSRPKKPEPERVEPMRGFAGMFESGPQVGAAASATNGGSAGGAVDSAYRVIDDYLRQGRRAAESLWTPIAAGAVGALDPSVLTERFMRSAADLSAVWFDLIQSFNAGRNGKSAEAGAPGPFRAGDAPGPYGEPTNLPRVRVAVKSARLAKVSVELLADAHIGPIFSLPLQPTETGAPPIERAAASHEADQSVTVEIHVADVQPPGLYHGLLINGAQKPCGTVTLELSAV